MLSNSQEVYSVLHRVMTEEKFELEEEFDSEMKKDRVKLLG